MDNTESTEHTRTSKIPRLINNVGAYLYKHAGNAARYYREIARGVSKPQDAVRFDPTTTLQPKAPPESGKDPSHE